MSITKEHGVVMLATEDKTNLRLTNHKKLEYVFDRYPARNALGNYQHLYFTSNEEMVENDWCYNPNNGGSVVRYTKYFRITVFKIIATTDPKLTTPTKLEDRDDILYDNKLPQIPKSFIESYVKNPVDKVELDTIWSHRNGGEYVLRLVNNEVVVVERGFFVPEDVNYNPVTHDLDRPKPYTKEEVESKLFEMMNDFGFMSSKEDIANFNNWIKENM